MRLRTKQIIALTIVAAAVAVTTSLVNAALLARARVSRAGAEARMLGQIFFHRAGAVIRDHTTEELRQALADDPDLRRLADAIVGYAPFVLYVAIVDTDGKAVFHSSREFQGTVLDPAESFSAFSERHPSAFLFSLLRSDQTLVVDQPFSLGGDRPFASVRVAISTLLLTKNLRSDVAVNALLAATAVLVVFGVSFYLARRLLAPVELLRRELARIDPGDSGPPFDVQSEQDVSRLASFFSTVSEKLRDSEPVGGRREDWLGTVLGGLSDAVIVLDREGRVLSLNRAACLLLQCDRERIETRKLSDLLQADHPIAALAAEALGGEPRVVDRPAEIVIDDEQVQYLLSAQALRESSEITGVMITARDMERLARVASRLSHSQKLTVLGQLSSGVAHEVRNPLNAMGVHAALLRLKAGDGNTEIIRHIEVIEEQVRRLDRVVQGFLEFTRPDEVKLENVDLGRLLRSAAGDIAARAERAGIKVDLTLPADAVRVWASEQLLRQAFLNLLYNSIDAISSGGRITLALDTVHGWSRVEVADDGAGIAAEDLPNVFRLYFTKKPQGSGIGLAVVYRIVQLHGGEIRIDSRPAEGTRVTVRLPGDSV